MEYFTIITIITNITIETDNEFEFPIFTGFSVTYEEVLKIRIYWEKERERDRVFLK